MAAASPPVVVALCTSASSRPLFFAVTETSRPAVAEPSSTRAVAAFCTELKARMPFPATDSPVPQTLPPEDSTEVSSTAAISASWLAETVTSRSATRSERRTRASVSTSSRLRERVAPTARESDSVRL